MNIPGDYVFGAAIADIYERHLVPLIFEPYAVEVARRLAERPMTQILELASGTGVLTRALSRTLPPEVDITATDMNSAMLDRAMAVGTTRPVRWQQADALKLPFGDATYDAVVCQFGVMFFPDKPAAFAEARRVLRPGGVFLFSVWDRLEENEFADTVTGAVATVFADNPPSFVRRIPHGYFDKAAIAHDLEKGGFTNRPQIDTVSARSRADSPTTPALAFCQGTPLRNEIEERGPSRLHAATRIATEALGRRFGFQQVDGKMQAHIVSVLR